MGFENLLRTIDCRVTVPVWNWALFSNVVWKTTPNYHMWDNNGGFGGNGNKTKGYCVTGGVFSLDKWTTSSLEDRRTVGRDTCVGLQQSPETKKCIEDTVLPKYSKCLRRRFNGRVPSIGLVLNVIKRFDLKDFLRFESIVRDDWHNLIHNSVGKFVVYYFLNFVLFYTFYFLLVTCFILMLKSFCLQAVT